MRWLWVYTGGILLQVKSIQRLYWSIQANNTTCKQAQRIQEQSRHVWLRKLGRANCTYLSVTIADRVPWRCMSCWSCLQLDAIGRTSYFKGLRERRIFAWILRLALLRSSSENTRGIDMWDAGIAWASWRCCWPRAENVGPSSLPSTSIVLALA